MKADYLVPILVAMIGALATVAASYIALNRGRAEERKRSELPRLSDLIANANPGDRIAIPQGVYEERLTIDKPVELVGEGKRSDVVIRWTNGNVITSHADGVRLVNLTLRQEGGAGWAAVEVATGSTALDGCDVSSDSAECVLVRSSARLEAHSSDLHDSGTECVRLKNGSSASIRDCVITNSRGTGIAAEENCELHVSGTALRFNLADAVAVAATTRNIVVTDNNIVGNLGNGLRVNGVSGMDSVLSGNSIQNSGLAAILLEGSALLVERNVVATCGCGIRAVKGSKPSVRWNRVHDINGDGFVITEASEGTWEQNDLRNCMLFGIVISGGSAPLVSRNAVDGCERGVGVLDQSSPTIEHNEIRNSRTDGMTIRTGSFPTVRHNVVSGNTSDGIYIVSGGGGQVLSNTVEANRGDGIVMKGAGRPLVDGNTVARNGNHGLYIHDGGGCVMGLNELIDNAGTPVKVADDCLANVVRRAQA